MRLLLVLFGFILSMGAAQAVECNQWNTPGCESLHGLAIDRDATVRHASPGNASFVTELGRALTSGQAAAGIYNMSRGANSEIVLEKRCYTNLVYVWFGQKVNSDGIRAFRGDIQGTSIPERLAVAPVPQGMIAPTEVFRVHLCRGEGGLYLPIDYLDNLSGVPDGQTVILICTEEPSLYPNHPEGAAIADGIHITAGEIRKRHAEIRDGKRPIMVYVTVPVHKPPL